LTDALLRSRPDRTSSDVTFEALFRRTYPRVSAYVRVIAAPADAEDVVAETYAIAWRRRASIPEGAELGWLIGVSRRVALNQRRGERRLDALRTRLSAQPDAAGLEPSELIADDELRAAVRALPPRDREALLLTSWFDLPPADAAQAVGVTAAAFRMRLARARRRLRAQLQSPESLPKERTRCDIPETM
jgi:RNA polymerase sigma-70 factor, ECF subfamily